MYHFRTILFASWGVLAIALSTMNAGAQNIPVQQTQDSFLAVEEENEEASHTATSEVVYPVVINDTIDKTAFQERLIADSAWRSFAKSPVYNYEKEAPKVVKERNIGAFERFMIAVFLFFETTAGKVLLWLVFVVLLLVVTTFLLKQYGVFIFKKGTKKTITQINDFKEEEVPQNWELAIRTAQSGGDYRLAVRLCYRHLIVLLQEKGLVGLTHSSSNRQFLAALRHKSYWAEFSTLLMHYEYLWYGQYKTDAAGYAAIEKLYLSIKNQL
jgi:hypothetical protein